MKLAHKLNIISVFVTILAASSVFLPFSVSAGRTGQNLDFGFCPIPGGQVVASYDDGYHWIAGESVLRWGSDKVYSKSNDNYTQCYCPELSGTQTPDKTNYGIQSDWLKASNIPVSLQNALKKSGWVWIDNGADFGLSAEAYLVNNRPFICTPICYPHTESSMQSKIQAHNDTNLRTFILKSTK